MFVKLLLFSILTDMALLFLGAVAFIVYKIWKNDTNVKMIWRYGRFVCEFDILLDNYFLFGVFMVLNTVYTGTFIFFVVLECLQGGVSQAGLP